MPCSAAWRARLLESAILAAALVAGAGPDGHSARVSPAVRMRLLASARCAGLAAAPPHPDLLACFDAALRRLVDTRARRREVARAMNAFVGTPWAATIVSVAEAVGAEAAPGEAGSLTGRQALRTLRIALGLPADGPDCA